MLAVLGARVCVGRAHSLRQFLELRLNGPSSSDDLPGHLAESQFMVIRAMMMEDISFSIFISPRVETQQCQLCGCSGCLPVAPLSMPCAETSMCSCGHMRLLHPPSHFSRRVNRDAESVSAS